MPLRMTGQEATLRWGYYAPAVLHSWTLAKADEDPHYTLTATVVRVNTFQVSQRPLAFVVVTKSGSWRWPILTLQINGTSLHATLGQKEKP